MVSTELMKDIILLSITNIGITIIHTWPLIYPYYFSYLYQKDHSMTAQKVFSGLIFYYIGTFIGNTLNPYVVRIIGYKNNLYIACILSIYFAFILNTQISIFYIFFARILQGIWKAIVWDCNNLFLSEKHPNEDGVVNAKYLHLFRYGVSAIMIFLGQVYINPYSENTIFTPEEERIFSQDVNKNFVSFVWLQSYIFFFSIALPTIFIKVPTRLESNLFPWFKSLFKKTDFRHSLRTQEISILIQTSRASMNLNQDFSKSFRMPLMDSEKETFIFEVENDNPERLMPWMILFTVLDFIFCTLQGDNFKYFSLLLGFSDSEISLFYFLSTFIVMSSNFVCAYVYKKYGFVKLFYFMCACMTLNFGIVFASMIYRKLYLFGIFVCRFYYNTNIILNDLLCFSVFDPNTGIKYVKLFTLFYMVSALIAIIVNNYFIDPENIYKTFYVFFGFNILNYILGYRTFKNFKFSK